jgi:hypothetical protein
VDQYCVVVCGLQAETSGDAAAWQPVAAALKLNPAEFERRVVAALPRIVRQHLDRETADRIAQLMHALHVDARVLPDDPQLAYIARAGTSCGPLPQSSLADFILPGESYRLHGTTEWQDWSTTAEAETAAPDMDFNDIVEAPPSTSTGDELDDDLSFAPPADVTDDAGEPWAEEPDAGTDDETDDAAPPADAADQPDQITLADAAADDITEPPRAVPPPLPGPPTSESTSTAEFSDDVDATAPDSQEPTAASDDELVSLGQEVLAADAPEASDSGPSEGTDVDGPAPRRSRTGRLVLLLVVIAVAVWAYRYWMADTRTNVPPPAVRTIQPRAQPAPATPPAQTVAGDASTTPPASPASVATAASTPAPAASAAAPVSAGSTPAPAATAPTPAAAASAPAPAASAATPAKSGTGALPARAATIMPAPSTPVAAASVSASTPPAH